MITVNSSVILEFTGGCSLSVLDRGKEGQEGKCASSTGRVELGAKERGKRSRRRIIEK